MTTVTRTTPDSHVDERSNYKHDSYRYDRQQPSFKPALWLAYRILELEPKNQLILQHLAMLEDLASESEDSSDEEEEEDVGRVHSGPPCKKFHQRRGRRRFGGGPVGPECTSATAVRRRTTKFTITTTCHSFSTHCFNRDSTRTSVLYIAIADKA